MSDQPDNSMDQNGTPDFLLLFINNIRKHIPTDPKLVEVICLKPWYDTWKHVLFLLKMAEPVFRGNDACQMAAEICEDFAAGIDFLIRYTSRTAVRTDLNLLWNEFQDQARKYYEITPTEFDSVMEQLKS